MDLTRDVMQGSMWGLLVGGALGALRHQAKQRNACRLEECKTDITFLKNDPVFLDAVLDVLSYAKCSKRAAQLCNVIARSANELVQCHELLNRSQALNAGVLKFKANRRLEALKDAASALSNSFPNDLDIGAYTDIVKQCADNYVHNMLLS